LNRDYYTILFEDIGNRKLTEVAAELAHRALKKFERPAFILCSTGISAGGKYFGGETLSQYRGCCRSGSEHVRGNES
jgi:hypothetical protein